MRKPTPALLAAGRRQEPIWGPDSPVSRKATERGLWRANGTEHESTGDLQGLQDGVDSHWVM